MSALSMLSASVPEGISIVSVECPPEGTPPLSKSFSRASYVIELATGASAEEVMSFFDAARELVIERTNKKKQLKTEDIKPRIFSFSAEDTPRGIRLECTLNFLNEALLNPFVLAGALKKNCPALGDSQVISVCKIKVE